MSLVTRYRTLTNKDLLQSLEDKRQYSDLIEELCQRLEREGDQCPVCDADLADARRDLQ